LTVEYGGGIYAGDSIRTDGSMFSQNTAYRGGGLYAGWLPDSTAGPDIDGAIRQSTFYGNQTPSSTDHWWPAGGGIAFAGKQLDINQSTVWRNHSDKGSGVYASAGTVSVVNSTISMNVHGSGAGLYLESDVHSSFVHASIVDNNADYNSADSVILGPTTIKNSIVTGIGGVPACRFSGTGPYTSGENLDNDGSCTGFTLTRSNYGVYGVADNGGPTYTNQCVDDKQSGRGCSRGLRRVDGGSARRTPPIRHPLRSRRL
jgi:hypothetical protein